MNSRTNQKRNLILSNSRQTLLVLVLSFFFHLTALYAQDQMVLTRINEKITLDGILNEPVWENIKPLPLTMYMPNSGQEPSERTEILLAYDDEYLYMAGRLYDSEANEIRSPSKKRDESNTTSDWCVIVLDTYEDNENGVAFGTTPAGLRTDLSLSNDGTTYNFTWNTFWDVATHKDDKGWYAEFRIPFSSLRFQDKDGNVIMGLIVSRSIARKNEFDTFPSIPPKWGWDGLFKISLAQKIVFKGIQRHNPLYVTPYVLGGLCRSFVLNDNETAYQRNDQNKFESGLDIKVGLTKNSTLDVTLNTDFAQVEADDQQINLTRFSLYFPEKRLFFQERSGVFDFSFGGETRIFYSRKIGLHEGKPIRIYGGMRLIGRVGDWDVGFIDMQTEKNETLPSENFGVLRLKKQILNSYSYIGSIFTTRLGADGSTNIVYGLDGKLRVSEDDYVLLNWGQCFDNKSPPDLSFLDFSRIRIGWERPSIKGVGLLCNVIMRGNDFSPGIGFEILDNYRGIGSRVNYGWLPGEASNLQSHYIFYNGYGCFRNNDNSLITMASGIGWGFTSKSGASGEYSIVMNRENIRDTFYISENIYVPPDEFTFVGFNGNYQTPQGELLSSFFTVESGSYYDGYRFSMIAEPSWYITPNIYLSNAYEFNHVDFSKRRQKLTSHIMRMKLFASLHTTFSVSAFVQYNSTIKTILANVRLHYNPREGTDIYLVYNDDLNTYRNREFPTLPYYNNQTLILKCSYTFSL